MFNYLSLLLVHDLITNRIFTVILPGYICCIKRAGPTLHWVARLDSTTKCIYSMFRTGTDHATFRLGVLITPFLWVPIGYFTINAPCNQ